MKERIIIVGGGIAGLSAGIYARRCGFQSTIFESHTRPGGVCTAWRRGPYLMDAGIRMIIGTAPPNPFYEFFREVGVIPACRFERIDQLHCIESEGGRQVRIYQDIEDLSNNLHEAAPEDSERIKRFIDTLADFSKFRPNLNIEPEDFSIVDGLRSLAALGPVARHFMAHWKKPLSSWLSSFRSRTIRDAFLKLYSVKDFPVLAMFTAMGWLIGGQIAKPVEGSLGVVNAMTDTYARLGGELRCGSRVKKILVDSDRAAGVRLENGKECRSDAVISAADGHATIFDMLGGRFVNSTLRGYYKDLPVFTPMITVHFGTKYDFNDEPDSICFPIKKGISIFDRTINNMNIHHGRGDGTVAPRGHSVVRVGIETDYEPWAELASSPEKYKQEKERIADEVLDSLEERYPGLARGVGARDVATPMTTERYTGNWKGAFEGWQPTTKTFGLRMKKTLPGLRNFYMAGQWVEPGGGVPAVVFSARSAMRIVCKHFKRKFTPGL